MTYDNYGQDPFQGYDPGGASIQALSERLVALQSQINSTIGKVVRNEGSILEMQTWITQDEGMVQIGAQMIETYGSFKQSTQATLSVHADEIDSRVTYTDYNGNEIASRINQTATTIQIQASKINLVGAVTVLSDISGNLGTITAGNINISNDISVGRTLTLGYGWTDSYSRTIKFNGNATIYNNGDALHLGAVEDIYMDSYTRFLGGASFSGSVSFSGASVSGLTANYASSAGNADTLDGYDSSDFLRSYSDIYVSRVIAYNGAFKRDDYNYLSLSGSGATIFVGGSLKASWSSIPKIRLDADGDGTVNENSFGVNNPGSMQPFLMDYMKVDLDGEAVIHLDQYFVKFIGVYDVFITGNATIISKDLGSFTVTGSGPVAFMVVGIQKGKENVCGYAIEPQLTASGDGEGISEVFVPCERMPYISNTEV